MLVRVLTLPFDPTIEGFNDEPVRDFLANKAVDGIEDHFFVHDGRPYLALVIRYRPAAPAPAQPAAAEAQGGARQRDESWRDQLDPADWPLFNRLRDWRGERSKAEGIPPYVICNNRQLAEIVKRRPTTLAALAEADGFGDAKLKKYGKELIALIARAGQATETVDERA
jgi:ATP-dependent DNA helicase RecQ